MRDITIKTAIQDGEPERGSPEATWPRPLTGSLSGRLLRIVLGCYVAVTLVVTGFQIVLEYKRAEHQLGQDVGAMRETFSPAISDAVWAFNSTVLHGILTGMKALPFVLGVKVVDEHGKQIQALGTIEDQSGALWAVDPQGKTEPLTGKSPLWNDILAQSFEIVHSDGNNDHQIIGAWTVYSSKRIMFDTVAKNFTMILVNSIIAMLALWLVLVVVFQRIVGRPLRQLSVFVSRLNIDTLGGKPFVLNDGGHHELHLLTDTLNLMASKLRRSIEENMALVRDLQEANASLQTKVAERTQELEVLARTDLLTGLSNRRKLDEVLAYESNRALRYGGALSVVIGDIDNFKAVNDLHGHQTGDLVIAGFGTVLRDSIRVVDIAGRWGGEEFMLICPQTDLAAAAALAETIRRRVERTNFSVAGSRTCSFGVSQWQAGEAVGTLVARADAALYRAKQAGRNRVEIETAP